MPLPPFDGVLNPSSALFSSCPLLRVKKVEDWNSWFLTQDLYLPRMTFPFAAPHLKALGMMFHQGRKAGVPIAPGRKGCLTLL